jgi:hypothetical protein
MSESIDNKRTLEVDNNEQGAKKVKLETLATPETICVISMNEDGTACYYWNQTGDLPLTYQMFFDRFGNDADDEAVSFLGLFMDLISETPVSDKELKETKSSIDEKWPNDITSNDMKCIQERRESWERIEMSDYHRRTQNGNLPLKTVPVLSWR